MKICIWCTKIFDLGGTKRVVTLLANELVKEHDVTIMIYQDRFKEDRNMYHMSEDIKVDFIDNSEFVNRHHTPAFCWRYLVQKLNAKYGIFNKERFNDILADAIFPKKTREKWVKYLNEQNYDIIITTAGLSLRLGMLAPELNAKTIGWQHNCYAGYLDVPNVVFWKQECLLQEYLPKLDRYIVLSDYDKRDYKKFLDIDTEVKINPRSFVSERKCDPKSKRFLMATRFVYAKGLDLMMESFEEFCKQDDEWQLDIIGAGDLWNQIVADAKRRGIEDRVNFVGYTNEPEKYYLNSSIFLLPSRWEGWPMVIMEAFEFGLPVIAFHTGAMDLIIDDGKTGYLPEAFDTKKFTDAMLKLAHDEELRREMSRNAIWKSEDFAIEKAVKEWNRLFNRVMGIETFYQKNEKKILECREKYPLRTSYAEFVKEYQLRDKTILYEAFGGRGMICNPYALFLYLLEKEEYQDYTHIWVLDDFEDNRKQIEKYEKYPNVRFVKYKSKEYCKDLATVKYLVNNVSFPSYFLKREGQVLIDGHDILKEPEEAKKNIGYLPEIPPLYMEMTVREYLEFAAELKGIKKDKRESQIEEVIRLAKLRDVENRLIQNLSKGYKQRVGLAQAVLGDPETIILDEPTVGLDPRQMIEMRELIRSLKKDHTVILSSHILSEVSAVCDQILIISKGELVASDTPDGLQAKLKGAGELELCVKGTAAQLKTLLSNLDGVESFTTTEAEDGTVLAQVSEKADCDIREPLFYELAENRMPLLGMEKKTGSLEDIFLQLTDKPEEETKQ